MRLNGLPEHDHGGSGVGGGLSPSEINNVVPVSEADDLPPVENGRHKLEDNTVYWFNGFVMSDYGLELGFSTPIIGSHGGSDGFIHTGGSTALYADGYSFFARNLSVLSPGGAMFDLTASTSEEILVESVSFADPASLGSIANMGTIDGYRVPSFKGCNFEDFDAGLTFTGTPDKVFIESSPVRNVSGGATCFTFDSNFTAEIVDITDCFVEGVEPGTEVVRVESGGSPTGVFQYRGVTHYTDVTQSNILNGEAGVEQVGYRVESSYPLPDSSISGELDLTATTTVTGSGSSATEVDGSFSLLNPERTSKPNGNRIRYDGKKDRRVNVYATASVSGANTEFELSVGLNGSKVDRSATAAFNPNSNTAASVTAVTTLSLETGDEISTFLENVGGSADLDVEALAVTL